MTAMQKASSRFQKQNIQRRKQQKVKLIQTPPNNVQWTPHMGNFKNQNKKLSLALKSLQLFSNMRLNFEK